MYEEPGFFIDRDDFMNPIMSFFNEHIMNVLTPGDPTLIQDPSSQDYGQYWLPNLDGLSQPGRALDPANHVRVVILSPDPHIRQLEAPGPMRRFRYDPEIARLVGWATRWDHNPMTRAYRPSDDTVSNASASRSGESRGRCCLHLRCHA